MEVKKVDGEPVPGTGLAAFAGEAREFDGAGPAGQAGNDEAGPQVEQSELERSTNAAAFLLVVVREVVTLVFKVDTPRRELDEATVARCAAEIGKADAATGGKLAQLLGSETPWMQCAAAIGPVLWKVGYGTVTELKARRPVDAEPREAKVDQPKPEQ